MTTNFFVLDALAKTIHDDNVRKGWWDDYDFTLPCSKPSPIRQATVTLTETLPL